MSRIKNIILLAIAIVLTISCSNDDVERIPKVPSFVRFNFLANSNNEPLQFPQVSGGLIPKSDFTNTSLRTLKVPVTLTSNVLQNPITTTFSTTTSGNRNAVTFNPENKLSFQGTQLTDTIYININERDADIQSITLKLESVSDASIQIGSLNNTFTYDTFTINFDAIKPTTYTFATNRIEITGEAGEIIDFKVNFPNGFIASEIDTNSIFEFLNGFNYSITPVEFDISKAYIKYRIILNEAINLDEVYYETILTLKNTTNYTALGTTKLQIVKPIKINRNVEANPASNFYNLADPFYRTYGETWNDFNKDGICQWSSYNAFTFPIVVSADNPNAVLYDNLGTTDTSDDIYHDAFKIGFKTPNAITTTTNSFNLKRWFSNESSSGLNSPGFDINPALEFFPENGTSTTNGKVLIIPQFITIAGTNGNSYSFAISGEGTYEEISTGIFELKFQLNVTNNEVLGGTVTADYRLYNTSNYLDPENLTTTNCVTEYTL